MINTKIPSPSDAELLALNAGEVHFSESPTKYPEAGHGTQYHAGAPGVVSFARAVLPKWGTQPAPVREPLTEREIELIDGMIEVQLNHAARCDAIANRVMAEKQKGWDMERVELLRKLKAAHGITKGGQHGT